MSDKKHALTVIAHRGGPGNNFVENSSEAFEESVKNKVPIETDVWLQGSRLVIAHNEPHDDMEYMSLPELFKLIDGRVDIYLDLKRESSALPTLNAIKKDYSNHLSTVVLTSFEKKALHTIRTRDKSIRLGLLYRPIDNEFIDLAEELNVDFVGFNWLRVFPNYFNIKQSREATELKHYAYTVNGRFLSRVMKSFGICGIFTDFPSRFDS